MALAIIGPSNQSGRVRTMKRIDEEEIAKIVYLKVIIEYELEPTVAAVTIWLFCRKWMKYLEVQIILMTVRHHRRGS